ncbi:COG4799 Acetyl-CoA carboxylase [Vibrio sp. B1FLJ16]|nr:COG4799 Acetyl-CoA carboxylase [Vibrio sp. B1FLJ16]CAE6935788.1 COG4799 Acetyl-CoA carboxylase [Vibrio sp. B1FLJ16]
MAIIKSKTKPNDDLFLSNKAAMEELVSKLHSDIETIRQGGGEKAILHQRKKGKLPVRERIKKITR